MAKNDLTASVEFTVNECHLMWSTVDGSMLKLRRMGFRHDDSAVEFQENLKRKLQDAITKLEARGGKR